jgi:hypothetical protein
MSIASYMARPMNKKRAAKDGELKFEHHEHGNKARNNHRIEIERNKDKSMDREVRKSARSAGG